MRCMTVPITVHVPGDPEGRAVLVFAASHPYLLVAPAQGDSRLRWVLAQEVELARVLYDQPWHSVFTAPVHEHE